MIGTLAKKILGYDRVGLLEQASRRYLEGNENVGGVTSEEIHAHVMDLNTDIKAMSAEDKARWYDHSQNKLRLNRFRIRLARTLQIVKEETDPIQRMSFLDFGAGTGVFLQALGGGTGLDANAECVSAMTKKGLSAVQSLDQRLPFADGAFAYSALFECLEHLENPVLLLREMKRITRSKIFISVPYVPQTRIGDRDAHGDKREENYHYLELSPEDLKKLCERLGFRVTRLETITPYAASGLPFFYQVMAQLRPRRLIRPEWTFAVLERS